MPGSDESVCCSHVGNSTLYVIETNTTAAQSTATCVNAGRQHDAMGMHDILRHPNEYITKNTDRAVGIELTGKWEHGGEARTTRLQQPTATDGIIVLRTTAAFTDQTHEKWPRRLFGGVSALSAKTSARGVRCQYLRLHAK